MRRALIPLVILLQACATTTIRLTPAFVEGDVRTYELRTSSTTTLELPGRASTVRADLVAKSTIQVRSTSADQSEIHVTLVPERYTKDGRAAALPVQQTADLIVGPDGSVRSITSVGGLPPEIAGAGVADLAPLLGPSLPTGRMHLGQTWHRSVSTPSAGPAPVPSGAPIEETGRVAALRVVGGYDCAILRIGARRPIARDQSVGDQDVRISGIEFSTSEIAFAFKAGFGVRMSTDARARFALESGTFSGGSLVVASTTVLRLLQP